ncbi:signal peptidase I [Microbacterium sp.]|uniref:signal peptidase I n=1 Tax=Microbacterium sp. TaxID=51671 RepID=UPI0039E48AB6
MTSQDSAAGLTTDTPRRRGVWPLVRDVLIIVGVAIVVSLVVKTFLIRSFYIPSGSMEQTLLKNDRILVDEFTPRFSGYERGDIVVFRDPGGWLPVSSSTPNQSVLVQAADWALSLVGITASDSDEHLIKRIIGVGGDHVVCCNALGQITVNGTPIDESAYWSLDAGQTAPTEKAFDVVVPEGSLWVLGDNRDHSRDSRYNMDQPSGGFVPLDNVVGRAFLITWPLTRFGLLDSHHEVFDGVPDSDAQ